MKERFVSTLNDDLQLFDDFQRTRKGRADHDSSQFEFLNTSAWKAASYVRNRFTEWAKDFPIDKDFVKRFKSSKNREHNAAFFELVMFQWFKKQNLEVIFQETSVLGSKRRPDFTLVKHGKEIAIAESTLSALPGHVEGIAKLENQIADILESIPSPNYFVNIDFVKSGTSTIPKKLLKVFIVNVIDEGQTQTVSIYDRRKWTLNCNDWQIDFSLFNKSNATTRTLGAISYGGAQMINSQRPLRTALNRKRARSYGTLNVPFIICINSSDFHLDEISIMQTLFGYSGDIRVESKIKTDDGFLLCNGKPQNTSVAAVLILKGLVPWNLHAVKISLWHNPWATLPLDTDTLNVEQNIYRETSQNVLVRNTIYGRSLGETLSIDEDYLSENVE